MLWVIWEVPSHTVPSRRHSRPPVWLDRIRRWPKIIIKNKINKICNIILILLIICHLYKMYYSGRTSIRITELYDYFIFTRIEFCKYWRYKIKRSFLSIRTNIFRVWLSYIYHITILLFPNTEIPVRNTEIVVDL